MSTTQQDSSSESTLSTLWDQLNQQRNEVALRSGAFPLGELPNRPLAEPDIVPIAEIEVADDCRACRRARTPAPRKTGVTNRSQCVCRGGHTCEGAPERGNSTDNESSERTDEDAATEDDYFDALRVDTLKLSARVNRDLIDGLESHFLRKKEEAKQDRDPVVDAHDGTELDVQRGTPDDNRRVILRSDDAGIVVTACGHPNTPWIAFTFKAHACWNHSEAELVQWARDFCALWGIEITDTLVSRMDLCTDVDERFFKSDNGRMGGRCGGDVSARFTSFDRLKGFSYERSTNRPLTFRIYDKRRNEGGKDETFWPGVWEAHDIDEDSPVWRIEFEAKRDRLRERGIDSWEDLTPNNLERFWSYCTEDFLTMDRQVWDRVQNVTVEEAAERADVDPRHDPERKELQIMGLAKSIADREDRTVREVLKELPDKYLDGQA